jgi:small GTP-binding protein
MIATHSIETPVNAVGAVSIITICSDDLDALTNQLGLGTIGIGQMTLRTVLGLDEALIARFDQGSIMMMPHGGIGNTRAISRALTNAGVLMKPVDDPCVMYPEAQDIHEARMLATLARAPSPLAVDVLLGHLDRCRSGLSTEHSDKQSQLDHLINPALVVMVGRANIGKSSLVNALAGSSVAMVADHEGTTRDHVGVMLELGGLVVRWVDTPGIDERVEVSDELAITEPVIRSADLIIHAIDHDDAEGALDPRLAAYICEGTRVVRVGLRSDLGESKAEVDLRCSVKTGDGIDQVAGGIRDRLIDPSILSNPGAWRFWDS